MSKINDLVAELCPDGVEYVRLGEVCEILVGGDAPDDCIKGNIPDDTHPYAVWGNGREIYGYSSTYRVENEAVCISSIGANTGDVFLHQGKFTPIIRLKVLLPKDDNVDSHYLYHITSLIGFSPKKSSVPNMSSTEIKSKIIPLPPLEIQREIVDILDKFTELEKELQKELELRKKQYEYYREKLLTFGEEVERRRLGEVCEYSKSSVEAIDLNKENYVGVENLLKDRRGKELSSYVPTEGKFTRFEIGDILIGNIRPYLKKIWLSDQIGGTSGDVLVVQINDRKRIYPAFLYHVLASDVFFLYDKKYSKGGKMPRGDKSEILNYLIPLPPLEKQREIASILDKFSALTTSLTEGLPAEIQLRRKQYNYYREKLLTFKRKES